MSRHAYQTRIDIRSDARSRLIVLLNQELVDALDLGLQLKHAHWNVKGPQFISLHELFDDLAEELEEHIDEMAERVVELGGVATGTLQGVAAGSRLVAYPPESWSGREHCAALAQGISTLGGTAREAIDVAAASGDADTADLFTGVSRALDKMLWKIEAHLQADS